MEPSEKPNRGHETSDARLKAVLWLVALTLGLTVVGLVSMWALFGVVVDRDAARDVPPSPLADTRAPFVGPRLQVSPYRDLKEMEAAEQEILDSYAWVDPEGGVVRIPIDRAMDLIVERRLPSRDPREGQREGVMIR